MTGQGSMRGRSRPGWVIGRVAGAPVVLAPSWLIVAAILTWIFLGPVRSAAPGLGPVGTVAAAAAFPVLLAVSVLVHEIGHGLTARRFGVPVTEYVITLWGGHTQFDRELRGPGASAVVSIAGPATNAVLAALAGWASGPATGVVALLLWAASIANGFVAVFNLLPGLPLDGGRVLEAVVWRVTGDRAGGTVVAAWAGRVLAVGLVVLAVARTLGRGAQLDVVTAVTILLVSGFLWVGASAALRNAHLTRRIGSLDLLALARPAVAVPADATLSEVEATAPAGVAVVLVKGATPWALMDPAAAQRVPTDLRRTTPAASVSAMIAPTSVVAERRGVAAVRAMSRAQASGRVAVLVDTATQPAAVVGVVSVESVASALGQRRVSR